MLHNFFIIFYEFTIKHHIFSSILQTSRQEVSLQGIMQRLKQPHCSGHQIYGDLLMVEK